MFEQALTKCLSILFIMFWVYPGGTVTSFVIRQRKSTGARYAIPLQGQSIVQAKKTPLLQYIEVNLDLKSGFDLNDEEKTKFKIWDKGQIPFYIDMPSFSDKSVRDKIRWFLNEVNSHTKLKFIELLRPPAEYNEERWVYFLNRQSYLGCHDVSMSNFTLKGVQRVVLGYDCLSTPSGLAEIVLALAGVPPQHNAPNRDDYIKVVEDNIIPSKKYLYKKLGNQDWLFHDLPYDYYSAGHYHQHKNSINGSSTIGLQGANDIGISDGFSDIDILKINLLYTYIVKISQTYMPECQKFFEEVEDLDNVPQSVIDLKPVPKPDKYLGISDNKESSDNRESGDNRESSGTRESSDKEESGKNKEKTEIISDYDENRIKDSKSNELTAEGVSDYETTEENLQKVAVRNRPKSKIN